MSSRKNLRILAACIIVIASVLDAASADARSYFNMTETHAIDTSGFPKWSRVKEHFEEERARAGEDCAPLPSSVCNEPSWQQTLERWRDLGFRQKLRAVNRYANEHAYIIDMVNWGVEDYWATPHEFVSRDGDCEDYAIMKYFTLRLAGIPAEQMRVIIVQDFNLGGIIHAILGVYDDNQQLYILDNQIKQVLPARRIYHYKPVYGINEEGWWAYYPRR